VAIEPRKARKWNVRQGRLDGQTMPHLCARCHTQKLCETGSKLQGNKSKLELSIIIKLFPEEKKLGGRTGQELQVGELVHKT